MRHNLDFDPDLMAIALLGALWLAGLILGLLWLKRPGPDHADYAEPDEPPRPTNGAPNA